MDKGAGIYLSRQSEAGEGLQENLKLLSRVLMNEIGGSMGPLYGTFFGRLARTVKGKETLDLPCSPICWRRRWMEFRASAGLR